MATMRPTAGVLALALLASASAYAAESTFEELQKASVPVYDLPSTLHPFVATCERSGTYFRRLFCTALNERLKAQHQSKLYRLTVEPSKAGPLVVEFRAPAKGKAPTAELRVRGCLTCGKPVLDREGGDISKARFFVFKLPKTVTTRGSRYDLGDIDAASYTAQLSAKMDEKTFRADVLPHLRLDLLYRPVAGVTKVGGKFKYGFLTFELAGHRAYDKCSGAVYGAVPPMKGKLKPDKSDWSCPQNRPKTVAKGPKLPSRMPQAKVKALMDAVAGDLHTCYDQFGLTGEVPAELEVTPKGQVKAVRVAGKLAKTDAGRCVEHLLKNVKFPSFAGDVARLRWPFVIEK